MPGALSYLVEMLLQPDQPGVAQSFVPLTDSLSTTAFDVSGLEHGVDHAFRVRAGRSGKFEIVGCVLDLTTLDCIRSVVVEAVTRDSVSLKWTPANGASKYAVFYNPAHDESLDNWCHVSAPSGRDHGVVCSSGELMCTACGLDSKRNNARVFLSG